MAVKLWSLWKRAAVIAAMLAATTLTARADVVFDWNMTLLAAMGNQPPFPSSRYAAIMHLALFEARNAITGEYEPYRGPLTAPPGASADAAAASAAHTVLKAYFPAQTVMLDAALAASLSTIPDGTAEDDGVQFGQQVGAAMVALRAADGANVPKSYLPESSAPGVWQLTLGCGPAGGGFLHWASVTPFAMERTDQFRPLPPPKLTGGEYTKDFLEVKSTGVIDSVLRGPNQTDNALFYARLSPVSWANATARQVAAMQGTGPAENARAFALLNVAIADAAIATFDAKYHHNFWRPETAVRNAAADDNGRTDADQDYIPLVTAPCFPSYPSAHGTLSFAAREVLERLFGPSGHDVTLSTPLLPGVVYHYTTFKAITDDVNDARVHGGIHFRFDQEIGGAMGRDIAALVVKNLLRAVPGTK